MNTNQKKCDFCDKVLVDDGVKKNYLSIKGSVCVNSWLKKKDRYSHLYMTQVNSRYIQDVLRDLRLTMDDFSEIKHKGTIQKILNYVDYPLFDFCNMECFEAWMKEKKGQAVEALYNTYLEKITEEGILGDVELESFGITKDDLKEFNIGKVE